MSRRGLRRPLRISSAPATVSRSKSHARDLTVPSQLVFKIEELLAVPFPEPTWMEREQGARRPRAHVR